MANPRGQQRDKVFRDALRIELAAAGENQRGLRKIARNLIQIAENLEDKDCLAAIREIRDTMDGKPTQAVEVGEPGDFDDMSDQELRQAIVEEAAQAGIKVVTVRRRTGAKAHSGETEH